MKNKQKRIFFYVLLCLALLLEVALIFALVLGSINGASFLLVGLSSLLVMAAALMNIKKLNAHIKH